MDGFSAPARQGSRSLSSNTTLSSHMRESRREGGHSDTRNPGQTQPGTSIPQPPTSLPHFYQGTFDVEEGMQSPHPPHMLRLALQHQAALLDSVGIPIALGMPLHWYQPGIAPGAGSTEASPRLPLGLFHVLGRYCTFTSHQALLSG